MTKIPYIFNVNGTKVKSRHMARLEILQSNTVSAQPQTGFHKVRGQGSIIIYRYSGTLL